MKNHRFRIDGKVYRSDTSSLRVFQGEGGEGNEKEGINRVLYMAT